MMGRPDAILTGLVQFTIVPPSTAPFGADYGSRDLVISPDGTQVVYSGPAPGGSQPQLNLRSIDHVAVAPIRGGEGGLGPFVSPDGQWVGFTVFPGSTTLHKVPIVGGPPVTLTTSSSPIAGASWGGDGQIIYGTRSAGLFRVSDNGGESEVLTTLDTEAHETSHTWPFIIPDREAVVFVIDDGPAPLITGQLAVLALDTGEVTRLGLLGVSPHYVSTGHLVYATADRSLQAVTFDATSLRVTGNPVSLVEGVTVQGIGGADFSVSENGRLVYALGANSDETPRSLVWVDRAGREEPIPAPGRRYRYPRISPDGTRVAVDVQDDSEHAIWVWDLAGETLSRLTSGETIDTYGHWTPDGQRIVFTSGRDGPLTLYWKRVNGTGTAERLTARDAPAAVNAVTPDGTGVLAQLIVPQRGRDLIVVSLDGGTETVILSTEFDEGNAALSPDGEWMAFETDESGAHEIHVRPFPDPEDGRRPISTAGGQDPVWSPDGNELFYWAGTRLMAAPIHTDSSSFNRGTPQMLFDGTYYQAPGRTYDVARDGRFLMVKTSGPTGEDVSPPQITVVLNWHDELLERVPVD